MLSKKQIGNERINQDIRIYIYDEETKNIVTEIFKDDITHFNYTF